MAYDFNGTNQYLSTDAPITSLPMTIACWFYPNTVSQRNLVTLRNSNSTSFLGALYIDAAQKLNAYTDNFSTASVFGQATTTTNYTINAWNHACGVFASSNSRTVYLNGENSQNNTTSVSAVNTSLFRISSASGNNPFNGRVADVGVWDVALSADDVATLGDGVACSLVRPDRLVAYFPLVRDLIEYIGGLTITNHNTATVIGHQRIYA